MMDIIFWIIFGAIVGWLASIIMGTNERQGAFANITIGIVGAIIGGMIARSIGGQGVTGFNFMSFLVALGGSIILISIVKILSFKH